MILYTTVAKEAEAEQTIERSRFITHIKPVETKEEGDAFVKEIKSRYKDATHNVPCMVIGDKMQIQWASDDGEPQGTSGAPMVQYLVREGITNVCVVVTRYFGGIKLGTGGLVRAYTSSAKLGVEAAGIKDVKERVCITFTVDYTYFAKLEKTMNDMGIEQGEKEFSDKVDMEIIIDPEQEEEMKALFSNVCNGTAEIKKRVEKNT